MHTLTKSILAMMLGFLATLHAPGQAFAFTNGSLAAANCKAASDGERSQAVALAQAAVPRFSHAMVHLHIDGLRQHQGARDESEEATRDWDAARDLAVGYCVTGNTLFLDRADALIAGWIKTYQPDFNPVDETKLEQLFLAADILDSAMPGPLFAQWQAFATRLGNGYILQIDKHAASADGRQSGRIKLAAMAAYTIADTGAIGHVESAFTTQLDGMISDGEPVDSGKRNSLHGGVVDLEPMVVAALAAHDHGENWYGITAPSGATLSAALAWLSPYASDAQANRQLSSNATLASSQGSEQGDGMADAVPAASTGSPRGSVLLYLYASALDRQWADLAYKLGGTPKLWQRLEMGMS